MNIIILRLTPDSDLFLAVFEFQVAKGMEKNNHPILLVF